MNTLARSRLYVLFCHLSTIPVCSIFSTHSSLRVCVYMHHTEKAPEKQIFHLISPYYHPDQYNSAQTVVWGEREKSVHFYTQQGSSGPVPTKIWSFIFYSREWVERPIAGSCHTHKISDGDNRLYSGCFNWFRHVLFRVSFLASCYNWPPETIIT